MSVSLASNVPGHEGPHNIVSSGDSKQLVKEMIRILYEMSDTSYAAMCNIMAPYLKQLDDIEYRLGNEALHQEENEEYVVNRGSKALIRVKANLKRWMQQLPVVSFNGGRYDLQLIKYELATLFADSTLQTRRKKKSHNVVQDIGSSDEEEAEEEGGDGVPRTIEEEVEQEEMNNPDESLFISKKGPTRFQALSNAHLLFLDVCYYLSPGYSYAKYLSTYGVTDCEGAKSYFPYEYVDSLEKLDETLPPYEAFFSTLRRGNTLDEDQDEAHGRTKHAELKALWERMGMTSLRDLLVYYNNCDVVPFLTALAHQCHLYKESGLDMLKDAPSLPGLGLRYGMKGLKGVFHTFSPGQADLAQLVMSSIVGGPSLVFCRLAEVGHTRIRSPDYGADALVCKALVGYDANSLYPWGMSCEMPVGPCLVRHEPNFQPELTEHGRSGPRHSQASLQWLAYEAVKLGYQDIQHAGNGPEVRVGQRHIPVDGYHAVSTTVFQFYGCVFHGHGCTLTRASADAWLGSEASDRRKSTDEIEHYLEDTCGYTLVTIWECQWEALKRNDPEAWQQTK